MSTICFILSTFPEFNEDYDGGDVDKRDPKDDIPDAKQYINGTFNGKSRNNF